MFVKVLILEKVRFFLLFWVFFNKNSVFAMDADIKEDKTQDLIGMTIQRDKITVHFNNYLYGLHYQLVYKILKNSSTNIRHN